MSSDDPVARESDSPNMRRVIERLDQLEAVGTVARDDVCAVADVLRTSEHIAMETLRSDVGLMFVTHLAMAVKRARAGEAVEPAPEDPDLTTADMDAAAGFVGQLTAAAGVSLPDTEVGFVAAYLRVLDRTR